MDRAIKETPTLHHRGPAYANASADFGLDARSLDEASPWRIEPTDLILPPSWRGKGARWRLFLLACSLLCTYFLPTTQPGFAGSDTNDGRGGSPFQRISQIGSDGATRRSRALTLRPKALRGCCGPPVEFVWMLDQEATVEQPFEMKILALDSQGRPAQPSSVAKQVDVDLRLSGSARLVDAEASPTRRWKDSALLFKLLADVAETVSAEVRISFPDKEALIDSANIDFQAGTVVRHGLSVRQEGVGSLLKPKLVSSKQPVGEFVELAVVLEDKLGNRASFGSRPESPFFVRTNLSSEVLTMNPASGMPSFNSDKEGIVKVKVSRPVVAEFWLESRYHTSLGDIEALRQESLKEITFKSFPQASTTSTLKPAAPPRGNKPASDQATTMTMTTTSQMPVTTKAAATTRTHRKPSVSIDDRRWHGIAKEVKMAASSTWRSYRQYAWGKDELQPVSKKGKDSFGGIGMTILDSLTTLWLMGLVEEFDEAEAFVRDHLDFDKADEQVSVFELVIRGVGGLLGAHALTGRPIFLDRAKELGNRLLGAFDTPSGMPWPKWNIARSIGTRTTEPTILAEAGSVQLEMRSLSAQTGDVRFREAGDRAMQAITSSGATGLLPVFLTSPGTTPVRPMVAKKALGALADSYYEYLLKQWLQDPTDVFLKDMWLTFLDDLPAIVKPAPDLSEQARQGQRLRIVELDATGEPNWKMDHLSCFAGGMLALALMELPAADLQQGARNATLWAMAEGITGSCVDLWGLTKTGLAPEFTYVKSKEPHDFKPVPHSGKFSFLRPETAESLFYLYRLTGDSKYRLWGKTLFRAIQSHAQVEGEETFSSVINVNEVPSRKVDEMQSFVMAETFKYLYLLFSPADALSLDQFVLNTEGHPLHRPPRTRT
mmetsp:Transcript_75548/g.157600  ORF Transcript_75548/g.157600 Transcript_75548/m.157600 type:complete len:888 (-) Transcript_75548:96-2759(-)